MTIFLLIIAIALAWLMLSNAVAAAYDLGRGRFPGFSVYVETIFEAVLLALVLYGLGVGR